MSKKTAQINPLEVPSKRRYDRFLTENVIEKLLENAYFVYFRTPRLTQNDFLLKGLFSLDDVRRDERIILNYNLKSITYGKWVNNEDRLNFLALLQIGLKDLQKVTGTKNIGKNILEIDLGGAGRKGAMALFNSYYNRISLKRQKRPDKYLEYLENNGINTSRHKKDYFDKLNYTGRGELLTLNNAGKLWIMETSGFGAFAHEYGHFIDYFIYKGGATGNGVLPLEKKEYTLEELKYSYHPNFENLPNVRKLMFAVFLDIYYKKKGAIYILSSEGTRIKKETDKLSERQKLYWLSYVELWARIFEVYTSLILERTGVKNTFLVGQYGKFGREILERDGELIINKTNWVYPLKSNLEKKTRNIKLILNIFANKN
jgi:hypothetical protein